MERMAMSDARPGWLTAVLEGRPVTSTSFRSTDRADLEPGDLWVFSERVNPYAGAQRVALVMDTDAKTASVTAALASSELDLAGDRDILLTANDTGAYPLIVETGFVATLPWSHARRRVGMVSDDLVDSIIDFIWDSRPPSLEQRRGPAWLEPAVSERVAFENAELDDLQKLARRTDPRFGGSESSVVASLDAIFEAAVDSSADSNLLGTWRRGHELGVVCEMTPAEGHVGGAPEMPIGELIGDPTICNLSDLRMLIQPAMERLLADPHVSHARCVDNRIRAIFESRLTDRNSDWIVVCSPLLVREIGRDGLVAITDDNRDVYLCGDLH
jgi:hypothetical protein